jgi:hypothetical protein
MTGLLGGSTFNVLCPLDSSLWDLAEGLALGTIPAGATALWTDSVHLVVLDFVSSLTTSLSGRTPRSGGTQF